MLLWEDWEEAEELLIVSQRMQGRVEILAQTLPWDWQKASPPVWHSSPRQGPVEEEELWEVRLLEEVRELEKGREDEDTRGQFGKHCTAASQHTQSPLGQQTVLTPLPQSGFASESHATETLEEDVRELCDEDRDDDVRLEEEEDEELE